MSYKNSVQLLLFCLAVQMQTNTRQRPLSSNSACDKPSAATVNSDTSCKKNKTNQLLNGKYTAAKNTKKCKQKSKQDMQASQVSKEKCITIQDDVEENKVAVRKAQRAQAKKEKKKKQQRAHRKDKVEKSQLDYSSVKKSCYTDFAYGFNKIIVPSRYWYTTQTAIANATGSHDALVTTDHISMMPLFRAAIGFQFDDVPCRLSPDRNRMVRLGFEVSFAKRKKAYQGTLMNYVAPIQEPLTIYQNITRGTFMFVGSFDLMRFKRCPYGVNFDLGVGLVGGALHNLKLYDYGTNLFRGEYLPAKKTNVGGFLGFSIDRYYDQADVNLALNYRVVISKVQYENAVIRTIGVPGALTYSNPAALSTPQYVYYKIGQGNHLRVYSNEVTLTLYKTF